MDNNTSSKLLFISSALMLIAGCIFWFMKQWLYMAFLLVGAFCCAASALNFKNRK